MAKYIMAGDYIRREDARRMVVQLDKYAWTSPVSDERRVTVDVDLVKFGLDRIPAAPRMIFAATASIRQIREA